MDNSSPVGVLEDFLRSSESDTNSTTSDSEARNDGRPCSRWRRLIRLLRTRSRKQSPPMHPFDSLKPPFRRSSSMREMIAFAPCFLSRADELSKTPWKYFTLPELQAATNNFSPERQIGKGGYAEVYKGQLRNGQLVAIKRLMRGTPDEIIGDFLSELGIMAHVNHRNTAKLVGYGVEGGMHLVLELSPHGSLASVLYS